MNIRINNGVNKRKPVTCRSHQKDGNKQLDPNHSKEQIKVLNNENREFIKSRVNSMMKEITKSKENVANIKSDHRRSSASNDRKSKSRSRMREQERRISPSFGESPFKSHY